jgi:hypothetical protein
LPPALVPSPDVVVVGGVVVGTLCDVAFSLTHVLKVVSVSEAKHDFIIARKISLNEFAQLPSAAKMPLWHLAQTPSPSMDLSLAVQSTQSECVLSLNP